MKLTIHAVAVLASVAYAAIGSTMPVVAEGGYAPFEDPLEHAFVLEVPRGWTARGGMFRLGYSDVRPMLDLKSPDGKSSIRSGDVALPRAYALPTAAHPTEGEPDDLGAQAQTIYANYRTGKDFAKLYALTRFKAFCHSLTPQLGDWTPPSSGNDEPDASAGSVTFRCGADAGGTRTAYVYAKTARVAGPGSLWHVSSLVSFIAPPQRLASIHGIIVHGARTFSLRPSWLAHQATMEEAGFRYQVARQHRRMAEIRRQVADFRARMRGMQAQVNSFERGQAARRSDFSAFDNAVSGVTPTVDPLDGRTRDVWTGPNHGYWENGSGTIVNSNVSPGSNYHALQPL